jgi:uncharacterized protein YycO
VSPDLLPVLPFRPEMLPEALRPMAMEVTEAMQTPLDFAGVFLVLALSAAVNLRARMQPKAVNTRWQIIPNLWGLLVAQSGMAKTPVINACMATLRAMEDDYYEQYSVAEAAARKKSGILGSGCKARSTNRVRSTKAHTGWGHGLKRLNTNSLKVGDIILTTTAAKISKAVRFGTFSDISHAMVYVEDHSVIDATGDGVQARNTQRLLFEDDSPVYALRLRDGLSDTQCLDICNFVRARVGTEYSVKEALRTVFGGGRGWTNKQFCSRLVAQAYASVGVALVEDPNFCSPTDLKDSPLLVEVNAATSPISDREAAQWECLADIPRMTMDATNSVLAGARKKSKNIQSFDDLDRHLIEHPEDDEYVCGLFEKSGYLTLWQVEKEKNPWQYDLKLMDAFSSSGAGMDEYCGSVLLNEQEGPNRYIVNRGGYARLAKQFGLRSFQLMLDLYDILAALHQTRVQVATSWLAANGFLDPTEENSASYLVPHTPEWFAALTAWNPPQADMTRSVIEAAGSLEVCSICGDQPARDYRLEKTHRAGVDMLRLCDGCLEIRKTMGDPFVPLPDAPPQAP